MGICDTYLDDIDTAYSSAEWAWDMLTPHVDWLVTNYVSHSFFSLTWRTHVALAIANLEDIVKYLIFGNWQASAPYRIPYYLRNCVGFDFDMGTLLSTMLAADPDQVEYFVGLVDAYRQSIWNRPFNADFYAALGRGFMIWP